MSPLQCKVQCALVWAIAPGIEGTMILDYRLIGLGRTKIGASLRRFSSLRRTPMAATVGALTYWRTFVASLGGFLPKTLRLPLRTAMAYQHNGFDAV
jgi:hypothetical protein